MTIQPIQDRILESEYRLSDHAVKQMIIFVLKFVLLRNLWEVNCMKNEILEELWKVKNQLVKEYDYDVEKLVKGLRTKEKARANVVDLTQQAKASTKKP